MCANWPDYYGLSSSLFCSFRKTETQNLTQNADLGGHTKGHRGLDSGEFTVCMSEQFDFVVRAIKIKYKELVGNDLQSQLSRRLISFLLLLL